jgi:hypothetical protein
MFCPGSLFFFIDMKTPPRKMLHLCFSIEVMRSFKSKVKGIRNWGAGKDKDKGGKVCGARNENFQS